MISRSINASSGLAFGFRWSILGILFALFYIASCDLFVPPDTNAPRFNTVSGDKHAPMLNPGGSGYQPPENAANSQPRMDAAYGASADIGETMTLPSTQPQAQSLPPAPAAATSEPHADAEPANGKSFVDHLAFWRNDDTAQQPGGITPMSQASGRQVPLENQAMNATDASAATQPVMSGDLTPLPPAPASVMATGSDNYPTLSSTPPNPTLAVSDDTKQRLTAARADMEDGRDTMMQAGDQLKRDAKAEPSLLASAPQPAPSLTPTAVPASMPNALPALPPPPVGAPVMNSAPMASASPLPSQPASGSAFERLTSHPLTAPSGLEQPAPAQQVASLPAPAPTAPALQPIKLTPPPSMASAPSVAPADSSIALTPPPPPLSAPASNTLDIAPPPAVASVAPPMSMGQNTLEPIRLTPPGGAAADMSAPPASPNGQPITLTPPQSYADTQGYMPASRYSQRRLYQ